ncbi:MAG: glycosyltransferase family 2 protein [Bacteroidales bacterium]|jgi:glycosyltransferase involved in cell wall biosynthesis|nr:glycosyltransferase family 2 protein [Bacteroidales bacterium]MDD3160554.1 glycosyltransferase family 2 protein [Bacteroidales bacterium]
MILDVLICTIDDGIERVSKVLLPEVKDAIRYKISHQYTDSSYLYLPEELRREDVQISHIKGKGLCRNRNNAIQMADGDIAILADDDVRYESSYFETIACLYKDEQIDVACFQIQTAEGEPPYKNYSSKPFQITQHQRHDISSIEITFRVSKIKQHSIHFDTRFGLGSDCFLSGEEDVFLHDCTIKQLQVYYFPYPIVWHPYLSTGKKEFFSKERNQTLGALTWEVYGSSSYLRICWYVLKKRKALFASKVSPFTYLYQMMKGISMIKQTTKPTV